MSYTENRHSLNQQVAIVSRNIDSGEIDPMVPLEDFSYSDRYLPERNALGAKIMHSAFEAGELARFGGLRGAYGLLDVAFDGIFSEKHAVVSSRIVSAITPALPRDYDARTLAFARFSKIANLMTGTIRYDLRQECDRRMALADTEQDKKEYRRLAQLTAGAKINSQKSAVDTVFPFVARPGTGTDTIKRTSKVLYDLLQAEYGRPPTMSELAAGIQNSYPMIARIANGSMDIEFNILKQLSVHPPSDSFSNAGQFNPEYFALQKRINGLSLTIPRWDELVDQQRQKDNENSSDPVIFTGCPALASTEVMGVAAADYKNVIHGTMKWYTDIIQSLG